MQKRKGSLERMKDIVTESKKVIIGMLSVYTVTQKIIELAQPNLVCDLI